MAKREDATALQTDIPPNRAAAVFFLSRQRTPAENMSMMKFTTSYKSQSVVHNSKGIYTRDQLRDNILES